MAEYKRKTIRFMRMGAILAFSYYLLIAVSLTYAGESVPGVLIFSSVANKRVARSTDQKKCDDTKASMQCASNCKTLLFCNPTDKQSILGQFDCPSDCDIVTNKCVDKRPADQCPESESLSSVCPLAGVGYYPDPSDCRSYSYCDGGKGTAAYQCPVGYVFNLPDVTCSRNILCGTINCYGKTFALHSTYPYLYALCSNNKIVPASYNKCVDETQQFDLKTFGCVAVCQKEGNIPHETKCNSYYRCLATGPWGSLEKTAQSCPPGQGFDKTKALCSSAVTCP